MWHRLACPGIGHDSAPGRSSIRLIDAIDADDSLHASRNRALLLVGFDGALRRSKLVGIDHEHLRPTVEGYRLWLPRSKGARPDEKVEVAVRRQPERHYCPVTAIETWRAVSGRDSGALFVSLGTACRVDPRNRTRLSSRAVARIIQGAAAAAGIHTPFARDLLR